MLWKEAVVLKLPQALKLEGNYHVTLCGAYSVYSPNIIMESYWTGMVKIIASITLFSNFWFFVLILIVQLEERLSRAT